MLKVENCWETVAVLIETSGIRTNWSGESTPTGQHCFWRRGYGYLDHDETKTGTLCKICCTSIHQKNNIIMYWDNITRKSNSIYPTQEYLNTLSLIFIKCSHWTSESNAITHRMPFKVKGLIREIVVLFWSGHPLSTYNRLYVEIFFIQRPR